MGRKRARKDSPEAPISHHWLDSTHITFGVLTAGFVHDRFKIEVSRFNGREPDQHRWNIETGPLDSTAVRLSANPTRTLSLQGSWDDVKSPEQLEPGVDQKRWSASVMWADEIAPDWKLAGTVAWGRKFVKDHHDDWFNDDAYVAEASVKRGGWTAFARGEITENRELLEPENADHGPAFTVEKARPERFGTSSLRSTFRSAWAARYPSTSYLTASVANMWQESAGDEAFVPNEGGVASRYVLILGRPSTCRLSSAVNVQCISL